MNRRVLFAVGLVLAVAVGLMFVLGGPGRLFGTRGGDGGTGESAGPQGANDGTIRDPASAGGSDVLDANGKPKLALLFGSPKSQRRGVGSLSARVVRFSDQKPVAGAVLLLSGTSNADASVALRATTDVNGLATMPAVPAGDDYDLRVEPLADPPAHLPAIAVAPSQSKDLGTIYVGQLVALSGRVLDEKGRGVPGADVRVFVGYESVFETIKNFMDIFSTLDREPTPLAKTETDVEGRFTFEKLSPGPVVVRAKVVGKKHAMKAARVGLETAAAAEVVLTLEAGSIVAGHVVDPQGKGIAGARLGIFSEGAGDPSEMLLGRTFADTLADGSFRAIVADGEKRLRAFVAADGYPTAYSIQFASGQEDVRIVLSGGAEVLVTVVEKESNQPIEGARVFLMMSDDGNMDGPESKGGMLVGSTGPAGTVTFAARPGVIEMVMASHPGHAGGMGMPGRDGGAGMMGSSVEVEAPRPLVAGQTNRVVVKLLRGVTMSGRVLDPQGQPISGAAVTPLDFMGGGSGGTRSAADGSYRLVGLSESATAVVTVSAPGWVQRDAMSGMMRAMSGRKGEEEKPPVPGADVKKDFTLYPAASIRGRVVGPEGLGVAGAQVSFSGGTANPWAEMMGGKSATYTAADGTYVLFDVDPVDSRGASGATESRVPPAAQGAFPAPEAPKGPHGSVRASADGFVSGSSIDFAIPEGSIASAPDIALGRGVSLRGKVLDAGGRTVAGAKVEVAVRAVDQDAFQSAREMMTGRSHERNTRTGVDGTFTVDTLPNGEVTLTVTAESAAAGRRTVKIENGAAPASVEFRLAYAAKLTGRAIAADGKPIAGATASIEGGLLGASGDEAYVAPVSVRTGTDGKFALGGLPPGRMRVAVSAEGHRRTSVEAQAGGLAVDVTLAASSPADAARLAEVNKAILEASRQMGEAKDDAERTAAQARLMELVKEAARLQKELGTDGGTTVEEAPPPK